MGRTDWHRDKQLRQTIKANVEEEMESWEQDERNRLRQQHARKVRQLEDELQEELQEKRQSMYQAKVEEMEAEVLVEVRREMQSRVEEFRKSKEQEMEEEERRRKEDAENELEIQRKKVDAKFLCHLCGALCVVYLCGIFVWSTSVGHLV